MMFLKTHFLLFLWISIECLLTAKAGDSPNPVQKNDVTNADTERADQQKLATLTRENNIHLMATIDEMIFIMHLNITKEDKARLLAQIKHLKQLEAKRNPNLTLQDKIALEIDISKAFPAARTLCHIIKYQPFTPSYRRDFQQAIRPTNIQQGGIFPPAAQQPSTSQQIVQQQQQPVLQQPQVQQPVPPFQQTNQQVNVPQQSFQGARNRQGNNNGRF